MLLKITSYDALDERRLMDVYSESNYENTDYFYPDEPDKAKAVRMVEAGFLDYLKNGFFASPGNTYWILEEHSEWVCAMRTTLIVPAAYYIEALETRPDRRRRGCASRLIACVIDELKQNGPFRLCDCVSKRNEASLAAHLKCGFRIVSEEGLDYLSGERDDRHYGLEYVCSGE
ncbi:MAG: GNAT family N-acetyltransferase [Clostridiales bacterium]|nr:GNAT family N-acetyltransferase [Clostridiales bacterium]